MQEETTSLSSDLDPFTYKPLGPNPNAIRLLIVKKVEAEGHVHCSLGHSCLQSCGEFHALSYEWGVESAMRTILVNGKPLQVRQNLWQFLRRVQPLEWSRGLPLWVDAICIDQGTIGERNHQVRLMSRIYAQAQTAIAWVVINAQVAHMQTRIGCAGRFRRACGTYEIAEFDMLVVGASKFSLRRWFEAYKRGATVFTYAYGMYAATADPDFAERMKLPDGSRAQ